MNNLQSKMFHSKWLMERNALQGLVDGVLYGKSQMNVVAPSAVPTNSPSEGDLAIINVSGILMKGNASGLLSDDEIAMGFTNVDDISGILKECTEDPTIRSIVLNFSSGGGEVCGIEELGRLIAQIDTEIKPVYGWTEAQPGACSAAYWLLSQCRKIGMTPSATVGSVGVYLIVLDLSAKYKAEGINVQPISSGKYKLLSHDHKPLNEDEEKMLMDDVKDQHQMFKDVVKSKRSINDEYLEGRSFEGRDALKFGFVDNLSDNVFDFISEIGV